jgi:hypothetical protein
MEETNTCEYCQSIFKTKYTLKSHISNNKSCLKTRGLSLNNNIKCKGCNIVLTHQSHLITHQEICRDYIKYKNEATIIELQEQISKKDIQLIELENLKRELLLKNQEILFQTKTITDLQAQNKQQKDTIESIAKEAINRPVTTTTNNTINYQENSSEPVIEILQEENEDESDMLNEEKYQLQPLSLTDDYNIETRKEDGYINVTNLCKAGNKQFKHWNSLEKTKAFLRILSNEVGIPTSLLVTHKTGLGSDQSTWVHPYVAINIAQWISPKFDVKVSTWVYEVMITGKIDITKTKSFKQLQLENQEKQLKIQYLTKKYVKSQPRIQFTETNVIYILTTPSLKKDKRYILGKATNLTNRLSTYNKSDEHEVVYYKECGDEDTMGIAEQLVFQRLKEYREQANRERFILPKDEDIELFIKVLNEVVTFVNNP